MIPCVSGHSFDIVENGDGNPVHILCRQCPAQWTLSSFFDDVKTFHVAMSIRVGTKPEIPDHEERMLRMRLVDEEIRELHHAHWDSNIVEIADAIADAIYVLCGMAVSYGIPLNEVWNEIQRSNMAKVGVDGKVRYRNDGKVLKPDGWTPPDIKTIIDHAYASA